MVLRDVRDFVREHARELGLGLRKQDEAGVDADHPVFERFGDAPAGLAQLVQGGRETGEALVDDVRVALVSATGSTAMGRIVAPRVARMSGTSPAGKTLEGRVFGDNNGLVANVVRYGTPLPGRDLRAMDRQVVFDDEREFHHVADQKAQREAIHSYDEHLGVEAFLDGVRWYQRLLERLS
jgi:hypothetical protein